ncbi:V-type proton ATPase subunit e 1-like [Ixodes scapularis]|nr:V-type proton ATPase subunit e 1 [Ixodes scapularis]XP_042142278.1 V-type proton ATPase subunit e 1-like [Ixodes scapularis]
MGPTAVPVIVNTLVWFVAGAILPWFVPKGENRGIVQTMMVLTSVCCYVFWLGPYMMQYHPIIGPQLDPTAVHVMNEEWK